METKNITSKAVQTKVANAIERGLNKRLAFIKELRIERFMRGGYETIEVFESGLPFMTATVVEIVQEEVAPWSKYDNVWYDMTCKPESYFDKDGNLQWRYIPSIEVHVGQRSLY